MKKKGSHVGVILSFMVFITFVIFLFIIIEPTVIIQKDKQNLLNDLEIELIQKFSADLISLTIITAEDINQPCIELEGLIGTEIEGYIINSHIVVKNESGDIPENVKIEGTSLFIEREDEDNIFFKIYYSEEFDEIEQETINPCKKLKEDEYSIKSILLGKEIFESKINKTKQEYEDNYTSLKDELNIPGGSEFGFRFIDKEEGIIIEVEEKNVSTSVYVEEIPLLYINKEANINSGFIEVKVW
ncbi:MAG: hypothetical protein ABIA78_01795 [archaeon]